MVLSSADIFQNQFVAILFLKKSFRNISRVSSRLDRAVLKVGIMKPACTCSTFHFDSSTLFAYEVIYHGFVVCRYFFSKSGFFFCCCCFFFLFSVILVECQAVWIQIMPVGSDLDYCYVLFISLGSLGD